MLKAHKHRKELSGIAATVFMSQAYYEPLTCKQCIDAEPLGFDFSFAFQPIVRASTGQVISYEALARGTSGEPFREVWRNVNERNLYRFDQACRVKAIKLATELKLDCGLNINFTPNAVYKPELCIRTTLMAAREYNFPIEQIHFEVTEGEEVLDRTHLVSNIFENRARQAIVRGILVTCRELGIDVLAEGVELRAEYEWLRDQGIDLFQGYYFARPAFEELVDVAEDLIRA